MELFTSLPEPDAPTKQGRGPGSGINWFILLGVLAFICACASVTSSWIKANSDQGYRDHKAGLSDWKITEMELQASRAETMIIQGRDAMKADDPKGAYEALVAAQHIAKRYLERWPDREFRPGVTVQAWFDRLESEYLNDVAGYFSVVIERIKRSEFDVQTARVMTRDFAFYGYNELVKTLEKRGEEIATARADAAAKWVRVTFSGNSDVFNDIIRAEVERKWNNRYGFRLVFGDPFDARETSATWKTIPIRTHLSHANNRILDTKEQALGSAMPRVPERVEVFFAVVGTHDIPTVWDELDPFKAKVAVPARVVLDPLMNQAARDAEDIIADHLAALKKELAKVMEDLPEFRFFPGVKLDDPLTQKDGRLNLDVARALIYESPETALERLTRLAETSDTFALEEICMAGVSTGAEILAPLVAEILPLLEPVKQRRIMIVLENKPTYGNYDPVLSLIRRPKPGLFPEQAVAALQDHLHARVVREVLLEKIDDPATFRRYHYAITLIRRIPLEEIEILAPAWITSEDERFAGRVFDAVALRHRDFAQRLIRTVFNDVPQSMQIKMLEHLRIDLAKADDQTVELFKRCTQRRDNSRIVDLAYESLAGISRFHRGWKVLRELEGIEPDSNRQQLIKRALMTHVEYLFPDKARDFLIEQLKGNHLNARDYAISRLLERSDSKTEILRIIASLIRSSPNDQKLIGASVMGLHQHVARGLGWDFKASEADLKTILVAANRHADVQIRQYAYMVMASFAKNNHAVFKQTLSDSLNREESNELRKMIQEQLKAINDTASTNASIGKAGR